MLSFEFFKGEGVLRLGLSIREQRVFRPFCTANNQPAATGNTTQKLPQRVRLLSPLPGGEGQGEGERHTNFNSQKTSNTQHRTSNAQPRRAAIRCWMLDVGRWMFPPS
jgi:hypothetical protein